jgi:hypothetical protein
MASGGSSTGAGLRERVVVAWTSWRGGRRERAALDDLLRRGEVSAEVAWAIQRELDLEEARAGR